VGKLSTEIYCLFVCIFVFVVVIVSFFLQILNSIEKP